MAKKKATLENYVSWRNSTLGGLIITAVYLLIAYIFASLALDSGSMWQYLLAFISLSSALQSIYTVFKNRIASQ